VPRRREARVVVAVLAVVVVGGAVMIVGGTVASGHPAGAGGAQSPGNVPTGASGSQAGGAALCHTQRLAVGGGVYTVQNNERGSGALECLAVADSGGFTITRSAIANLANGARAATRPSTGAATRVPARRTAACRCRSPGWCHGEP
jgi:hypothetical protein